MDITCIRCGALIPADDINLLTMVAKCRACNAVFSISDQIAPADERAPRAQLDVPMPARFTTERSLGALHISWRWFTMTAIVIALFAVVWNAITWTIIAIALLNGAGATILFSSLHLLAGIAIGYYALLLWLNTTTVTADSVGLSVRHGPLPLLKNVSLPRDSLRQLYCLERITNSRRRAAATYDLQAIKADGTALAVVRMLQTSEEALYLEQELERFLGLKDEAVRGELAK